MKNIASGTYEQREAALRREAMQSEAHATNQAAALQTMQGEEAGLQAEQATLSTRLASLKREVDGERAALAKAATRRDVDQAKLSELEQARQALEKRLHALSSSTAVSIQ